MEDIASFAIERQYSRAPAGFRAPESAVAAR